MNTPDQPKCTLCGEPMPPGEEMFKYHGYSGPCPKPPLPKPALEDMTEPELKDLFNKVAGAIKSHLPPGTGFILLASPVGRHGVAQYVANVERECAAEWMVETVARWQAGDHVPR